MVAVSVGEAEVVIERRSVNQRRNMLDICCVARGWSSGRDTCKLYIGFDYTSAVVCCVICRVALLRVNE